MLLWFPGGSEICPSQRVFTLCSESKKNSFQTSTTRSQTLGARKSNLKLGSVAIKCGVFSGSAQKLETDFIFVIGRNKEMNENKRNPASSLRYESHGPVINSGYFLSFKAACFFKARVRRVRLLRLSRAFSFYSWNISESQKTDSTILTTKINGNRNRS